MGADEALLVGTFENFVQTSVINGEGPLSQQEKSISEGDLLTLNAQTPNGTFFGGFILKAEGLAWAHPLRILRYHPYRC